jgi:hypothetical protein
MINSRYHCFVRSKIQAVLVCFKLFFNYRKYVNAYQEIFYAVSNEINLLLYMNLLCNPIKS